MIVTFSTLLSPTPPSPRKEQNHVQFDALFRPHPNFNVGWSTGMLVATSIVRHPELKRQFNYFHGGWRHVVWRCVNQLGVEGDGQTIPFLRKMARSKWRANKKCHCRLPFLFFAPHGCWFSPNSINSIDPPTLSAYQYHHHHHHHHHCLPDPTEEE